MIVLGRTVYQNAHHAVLIAIWPFIVVQASDADEPNTPRSQVFYRLPNTNNRFTIDGSTGEIRTTGPLDYETQNRYVFIVEASDSSVDQRTGTATVTINVQDLQDQIPLFVETSVQATILETASIGSLVATLTVRCCVLFSDS